MANTESDEKLLTMCFLCICYTVSSIAALTLKRLISISSTALQLKDHRKVPPLCYRIDLSIHVLLHELYPAKEASSRGPLDCAGRLSHQDFIMALQKIDLEGLTDSVEEASILFQANQLPLTSLIPEAKCKPGPSSECTDLEIPTTSSRGLLSSSSQLAPLVEVESCERLVGRSKQVLSVKEEQLDPSQPTTPLSSSLCIVHPCDQVTPQFREDIYSPEIAPIASVSENFESPFICLAQTDRELPHSNVWPSPLSSLSDGDCSSYIDSNKQEDISSTVLKTAAIQNAIFTGTPGRKVGNDADFKLYDSDGTRTVLSSSHHVKIEDARRSRRKAPLCAEIRHNSTSSTSDLDICDITLVQNGCSSDSEVDYRSERQISISRQSPAAFASSRDSWSKFSASWIKKSASESRLPTFDETDSLQEEQSYGNLKTQWNVCGSSVSSSVSSNKRERHCRDAEALEAVGVPFTYDEVVCFTNEEFRELKNSTRMTQDQINVMLEARRRATNRQAAERCRQRKVAVRDEVTEQLAELRLQRKALTQRLLQARRHHQETRDSFITEQKRLLAVLRGPTGDELKYSDWRIRLTKKDEVVVMAAGH